MGVHSCHQSIVEELNTSFTCNLDNDKHIHVPSDTELIHIPPAKLRRFTGPITKSIEKIKKDRSLQNIHSPIRLRYDELREIERRHRLETNNIITEIFLDLMVDLCNDTLQPIYWKMDHQQISPTNSLKRSTTLERKNPLHNQGKFSKEKYLLSKTEGHERDFYRLFIDSAAFQLFIDEERTSTTPTEFRKICQLRAQVHQYQPYFDTTSNQMLLPLPDWPSNISTHYLDSCIETFTNELENAEKEHSSVVISIYAYLRGCALLARGRLLDGLRDLYLIENPNLFPKHYIQTTIVPLLVGADLLDQFREEEIYINSPEWKKLSDEFEGSGNSSHNSTDFPPLSPDIIEGDLSFEQFHDYVHRSSIVNDKDTAEILFKALLHWTNNTPRLPNTNRPRVRRWSLGGNTPKEGLDIPNKSQTIDRSPNSSLPSKLFELFLEIWQQTNAEKARMNYCLPKDRQKQESILMVKHFDYLF